MIYAWKFTGNTTSCIDEELLSVQENGVMFTNYNVKDFHILHNAISSAKLSVYKILNQASTLFVPINLNITQNPVQRIR